MFYCYHNPVKKLKQNMFSILPKSFKNGVNWFAKQRFLLFQKLELFLPHTSSARDYHAKIGEYDYPSVIKGIEYIKDAALNKGLGFTLEERQALGIHGLLPPRFRTQEQQVQLCYYNVMKLNKNINRFVYLIELQERHEKLFFRLLSENVETLLPIIYIPTISIVCQKFGLIYRRPRGIFLTIHDKGHCYNVLKNWPVSDVRAVILTDGEHVMGLGDLGASGMGVAIGKVAMYTALAGIKPHQCLPITIDIGINNEKLINDPLYYGIKQKRIAGSEYDAFIDECMEAVTSRYGQDTLIQFEDFGKENAFHLLDRYSKKYCTFNNDIQGTAAVVVAGLLAARNITGKQLSANKILFFGAGKAGIGCANLCVKAMQTEGLSTQEARDKIWMMDTDGLIVQGRPEPKLAGYKKFYAKEHSVIKDLATAIKEIKPTVLIGLSTVGGAFTPEVLKEMANVNERPVVFSLSNPTAKSECTSEEAYNNTDGRCVFSSGSPFPPVKFGDKMFYPGQGNNVYVFPGIALGIVATGMNHVPEDIFLIAAQNIANLVTPEDIDRGSIFPPLSKIRECSIQIATEIAKYAYEKGIGLTYPEPVDKRAFIMASMYNYMYESVLPVNYSWPVKHVVPKQEKSIETSFEVLPL